jgi:hypothetical protein
MDLLNIASGVIAGDGFSYWSNCDIESDAKLNGVM